MDILDLMDKNLLNNSNKAHAARVDDDNLDHVYKTLGRTMGNLEFWTPDQCGETDIPYYDMHL